MSPYLLIILAEILANFIRRDKDVEGFMTSEVQHRLSQFTGDMTYGSGGSFLRAVEVPDGFQMTSGLKVNDDKTKVL